MKEIILSRQVLTNLYRDNTVLIGTLFHALQSYQLSVDIWRSEDGDLHRLRNVGSSCTQCTLEPSRRGSLIIEDLQTIFQFDKTLILKN